MGVNRKQARRAVKKQQRGDRLTGRKVSYALVDEHYDVAEQKPLSRIKRDNSPIEARNEAQGHYLANITTKSLIFATGEAGCGKTFLATAFAAEQLLSKRVQRIIVTRPVLQAEEDLGFLPGDVGDKFAPYFRPVYDVLQKRLGASFLEYSLRPEIAKVEIAPFAYMRGRTFEDAVVILDEAQNVTPSQMKMFLTRMGENVTVIVNGDITQCDLPDHRNSGLSDALDRFTQSRTVGLVEFTAEDCVRSELCRTALEAYQ